eukprot:9479361-Pyramimonas_sp.AAC.1
MAGKSISKSNSGLSEGHMKGSAKGKYRSSVDAREPQNPTTSEEYQKHKGGFTKRNARRLRPSESAGGGPGAPSPC